jgi:hypothetical protein
MRTRILIPLLAAAFLAPTGMAPVAAGEATHERGFRGHAQHQREWDQRVKPQPPRFGWGQRSRIAPPFVPPHFARVGRPHASRGWYVPPRRPYFAPPRSFYYAPPVRPHPYRPPHRPRVVIVAPWRW